MERITKNLLSTIDFINEFRQDVVLKGLPFEDKNATLSIDNMSARLSFQLTTNEAFDSSDLIFLDSFIVATNDGINYVVPNHSGVIGGNMNFETQENNYHIDVSHLMDERWNKQKNYYYRLVLPVEDIFWIRKIHTNCYQAGNMQCRGLIKIAFDEGVIQVYPVSIKEKKYVVVESQMKCTYEMMQRFLYAISLSLGLVTSVIPFDYSYIIACDSSDFSTGLICGFTQMRPTIKGQYNLFTTNMYFVRECLKKNGAEYALPQLYDGKEFLSHLQDWMQMDEFENIVKMLYNDAALARATLILIESSTASLDYQGAMCCVALETICSALEDSQNKSFMNRKEWKEKVFPLFDSLIEKLENSSVITNVHAGNMRNKINTLNMQTNKDKLLQPFIQRGYEISKYEKNVIDNRNRFLHGHILGHCYEESFQEIMYSCLELQKLCAILLFRESGFKGYVVNNAVLLGLENAIKNNEPVLV